MHTARPLAPTNLRRDLAGWATLLAHAEVPVSASSAEALEELRLIEDEVDAHTLAGTFGNDPLMTLKVLVQVARKPSPRRTTDPETLTEALVMLGIGPFFRAFGPQISVEQHLAAHPQALRGLQDVLQRAYRAAGFALGFAVHRMDHDAPVIHEASLLHDFAEMLLWCHAPAPMLQIQHLQAQDPTLRTADAQREVLGIATAELQQRLMRDWRLPELLVRISDDQHADSAQVRNVLLAMRLARHTALGWDNPAIPDDVSDIAELLTMGVIPTQRLLQELDS